MFKKIDFGPLPEGRNLTNGSGYSSRDREIAVNKAILIGVMQKHEPTYADFAKLTQFDGVGTNYLGRYCRNLDRTSVKKSGESSQTTKILATAANAAKAYDFLQDDASNNLEDVANELGMSVENLSGNIIEWLAADRSESKASSDTKLSEELAVQEWRK